MFISKGYFFKLLLNDYRKCLVVCQKFITSPVRTCFILKAS
jgi:hypothetical protein